MIFSKKKPALSHVLHQALDLTLDESSRLSAAESLIDTPLEQLLPALLELSPSELDGVLQTWLDLQGCLRFLISLREGALADTRFAAIAKALGALLRIAFSGSFLNVQQIDWRSPALLLERVMQEEQVHQFAGWLDMKNRLDQDRRLFVLTHVAEPLEPLAFLEVALTRELADSVQAILAIESTVLPTEKAKCAIFYSINSVHAGLRGISFGERLIHEAVDILRQELPQLKTFSTLSPVPSLRKWLTTLQPHELAKYAGRPSGRHPVSREEWATQVKQALSQPEVPEALKDLLLKAAADYLTGNGDAKKIKDPVAKFHLGNGARLERINWAADTSPNGVRQSFGLMVNYLYDLASLSKNKAAFRVKHNSNYSRAVHRLVPRVRTGDD